MNRITRLVWTLFLALATLSAAGADYPAPRETDWTAREFRFHTGETLRDVKLHYTTIGSPKSEPVLVLHGTGSSATSFLNPQFAGELFGPGQPLDASRYYVILPDALGTGKSTKPSDGLRARFPKYNYDDMVLAQYRLVTEGLGIRHLRLVLGNSMGGMQAWIWGVQHPEFMDAIVPMACQPIQMSGRNWMMRRLLVESIRRNPDYHDGNYTAQPRGMQLALTEFAIATSGGTQAYFKQAPTREQADKIVFERIDAPFRGDANDLLYQWESSDDYNPSPGLERIQAVVLAINSADDERNPPEIGVMEREMHRVKSGRLVVIPASAETRGHATTGMARFWKGDLAELLEKTPRRAPAPQ